MKTFLKTIGIACALVAAQSCSEDFLEKSNPNTIGSDNFGSTEEEVERLVVGAYSPLNKQFLFGRWQQITDNIRSDEARNRDTGAESYALNVFAPLSPASPPAGYGWDMFYVGVFRANFLLETIEGRAMEGSDADQLNEERGEAHFLRAYYYFWLLLNYNNIPLVTETPTNQDEFYPTQAAPEDVWQFVIDEFTLAKQYLPDSWPASQLGRATKGAATACLGRAYLFRYNFLENPDDLTSAKTNFDEVLASGRYSLTADYFANFSLDNEFNSESLFEIAFGSFTGATNYGHNHPSAIQGNIRGIEFAPKNPTQSGVKFKAATWASVEPEPRAFNEFSDLTPEGGTDPRRDATFHYNKPGERIYDVPFTEAYGENSDYIAWKKYQVTMYPDRWSGERVNNVFQPINYREFRLADMLLLLAEVENELGNTGTAVEYINDVRERAGVVLLETDFSQQTLRQQLVHERAVELCGEGKRWYDLLRWGLLEEYISPLHPEFTPGRHEYLPIPALELSVNPNLKDPRY